MKTPHLDELIRDLKEHIEVLSEIKRKSNKKTDFGLEDGIKELNEYKRIKEKIVNL